VPAQAITQEHEKMTIALRASYRFFGLAGMSRLQRMLADLADIAELL